MSNFEITQSSYINKNVDLYVNSVHTQVGNVLKAEAASVTTTFTVADIAKGILVNTAGSGNSQFPTAAQLVAAYPSAKVGDCISFLYVADGGDQTLTVNTGLTLGSTTPKIFRYTSRLIYIRFTNITASSEACVAY